LFLETGPAPSVSDDRAETEEQTGEFAREFLVEDTRESVNNSVFTDTIPMTGGSSKICLLRRFNSVISVAENRMIPARM
jgi:hypothetical protein